MIFKDIFNHKIPLPSILEHFIVALLFGFLTFLELIMYQPWATYSYHAEGKVLLLAGYGLVAFVCYILFSALPLLLIKEHWKDNNWDVKKELVALLSFVLITSFSVAFYHAIYFKKADYNLPQMHNWILAGFQLGLFPLLLLFIWKWSKSKVVNTGVDATKIADATATDDAVESSQNIIIIKGDNKKEEFDLDEKSIVYLKSDKNYIELYYLKDNKLEKLFFRATMTNMVQQLPSDIFMRIHKSYMVNVGLAVKIYTLNSAYVLLMQLPEKLELPVSRTYLANARLAIEKNSK